VASRTRRGSLKGNPYGTATVEGTVGSCDEDFYLTTKDSIAHTLSMVGLLAKGMLQTFFPTGG
jgi:hypothetical protein